MCWVFLSTRGTQKCVSKWTFQHYWGKSNVLNFSGSNPVGSERICRKGVPSGVMSLFAQALLPQRPLSLLTCLPSFRMFKALFQGMVPKLICLPRLSTPSQFGPSLTPLGFLLKCRLTSKASLALLPSSTLLCALASLRRSYHHPPFLYSALSEAPPEGQPHEGRGQTV